jgi:hypothetical protein
MLKSNTTVLLSGLQILMALQVSAQVYAQGIHAGGVTDFELCSVSLPFPPHKYRLTEMACDDTNGMTFTDSEHKDTWVHVPQNSLKVECGSDKFIIPLDFVETYKYSSDDGLPMMKGSGDLARLITLCATNRGGHITTNALPVVSASWIRQSRPNQDVIVVRGDHFAEVQKLLELSCSTPGLGIASSEDPNGHSITYAPDQIGVVLNLTIVPFEDETIVSIIGNQKP